MAEKSAYQPGLCRRHSDYEPASVLLLGSGMLGLGLVVWRRRRQS